jgi:hypothetical protein
MALLSRRASSAYLPISRPGLCTRIRRATAARSGQCVQVPSRSPSFICARCGGSHDGPPRAYAVNEPAGWGVTADPSSRRWGELFEEQAILHGPDSEEAWFIRAVISTSSSGVSMEGGPPRLAGRLATPAFEGRPPSVADGQATQPLTRGEFR